MSFYDDDQVPTLISADEMRAKLTAEGVHLASNAAKGVLHSGDTFADKTNKHFHCEPQPRVPVGVAPAVHTSVDTGDLVAAEVIRLLGRAPTPVARTAAPGVVVARDTGDEVADALCLLLGRTGNNP